MKIFGKKHKHQWEEYFREQGYEGDVDKQFYLTEYMRGKDTIALPPITCVTYVCTVEGCHEQKQQFLRGHVKDMKYQILDKLQNGTGGTDGTG